MTQSLLPAFIISSSLPDSLMSCCLICVTSRLKCCKCACSISPNSYFLFSTLDDITYRGCILSGSDGKESTCSAGDTGLIPGSGRFPGEVNGNLLQDSYLESPMDRGTRWATVYEVTKESHVPEWLSTLLISCVNVVQFLKLINMIHYFFLKSTVYIRIYSLYCNVL